MCGRWYHLCYLIPAPTILYGVAANGGKKSVSHSQLGSKRKQLQPGVCTRCERDPKIATLNALGIDRAIRVVAKWTLVYYKVPVGTSQTKLFSLLPIYQEGINLLRGKKKRILDF